MSNHPYYITTPAATPLIVENNFCTKRTPYSATHQIAWAGSLNCQIAWAARELRPLEPPLKFSPYSIFRAKGGRKTINCFSHFHGLFPDTNYRYLDCFVMLGTHSKLCRGQMSHICDISLLRVKN